MLITIWTTNLKTPVCSTSIPPLKHVKVCTSQFFTGTCPPGVDQFLCFADPCQVNSCPNFPEATCRSSFCGGCFASFFDSDGNNVTDRCSTRPTCEDGTEMVDCFRDPCDDRTCPEFPEARCVSDFCGGCNFRFVTGDGEDVTRQCQRCEFCNGELLGNYLWLRVWCHSGQLHAS